MADTGTCTLEHLRSRSDEEIKEELLKYKGVGPKTAACVLMFAMGRFEFPVVSNHAITVSRCTRSFPSAQLISKVSRVLQADQLSTK